MLGYSPAMTLEKVLRQAGDELTRANVMKQAANQDPTNAAGVHALALRRRFEQVL